MMNSIETVAEMDLTPNQVENLLAELQHYHSIYSQTIPVVNRMIKCMMRLYPTVKSTTCFTYNGL